METSQMSDEELKVYKKIKGRISELEKKLEFYRSEIPCQIVREREEAIRLTLKANTEMLHFLFGEGCLTQ